MTFGIYTSQINFNDANDIALKHLIDACKPAIFGRNNEDVFDESYRKAGELDQSKFAVKLKVDEKSLLKIVHTQLLEGRSSGRRIEAELYKLNVYGMSLSSFHLFSYILIHVLLQARDHSSSLTRIPRAVEGCSALLSLYTPLAMKEGPSSSAMAVMNGRLTQHKPSPLRLPNRLVSGMPPSSAMSNMKFCRSKKGTG